MANSSFQKSSIATPVSVANGGTGSGTAATGLSNLGGAPTASPTFTGTITTPAIKITTGAALGKVLTSDADGDATWETASGGFSPTINSPTDGQILVYDLATTAWVNVNRQGSLTAIPN